MRIKYSKSIVWVIFALLLLFAACRSKQFPPEPVSQLKPIHKANQIAGMQRTVVVLADDKSEAKLGSFPWERSLLGQAIQRLESSSLIVIGFSLNQKIGFISDQALIDAIWQSRKVILQAEISPDGDSQMENLAGFDLPQIRGLREHSPVQVIVPYLEIADNAAGIGFSAIQGAEMRLQEPFPLLISLSQKTYLTLPMVAAKEYLRLSRNDFYSQADIVFIKNHSQNQGQSRSLGLTETQSFPNKYAGMYPQVFSFVDLINGKIEGNPFAGKIVIISYHLTRIPKIMVEGKKVSPGVIQAQRIESLLDWFQGNQEINVSLRRTK